MSNIIEYKPDYKNELSTSDKFWTLRTIHQNWLDKLTPPEYMVIMFIWNRTTLWSKTKEFICFRHFLNGIPNVISPLPFKKSRLGDILRSLEKKRFIIRERTLSGSYYKINYSRKTLKTDS